MPSDDGQFRIECDASYYAVGAVLSQQQPDGIWKPVAFRSSTLTDAQRNYQIYDKEFLAIIEALSEWRQYLLGAKHTIDVVTDHRNLEYYRKPQNLTRRQADWVTKLQEYDILLRHRPGRLHSQADFLSRPPNADKGDQDNKDVIALPAKLFSLDIEDTEHAIPFPKEIFDPKEQQHLITEHHDTPLAGHPGIQKTVELLERSVFWPTLRSDVEKYVRACPPCQANKPHRYKVKAPLHPVDPGEIPFKNISLDLIGPLPVSNGSNAILVIVDKTTKKGVFIPTNITLNSPKFAKLFIQHWVKHFGIPATITSDLGPQFVSDFIKAFYEALGIQSTPSTAYHPQTDGQTERVNQELEIYLRFFINSLQNDWDVSIPLAEFAYNDKIHSTTKITPHYATIGVHPWKGNPHAIDEPRNFEGDQFGQRMEELRRRAHDALLAAQATMKAYHDRKKGKSWQFSEGDLVWLEATNIKLEQGTKKFAPRRFGPFPIIKKHGPSAFELRLPHAWSQLHPVFNEALLTPYTPPITDEQTRAHTPPPPIVVDDNLEYHVDYITDFKKQRGKPFYKVHWQGYSSYEDSWEPLANLEHAQEAIKEYHDANPTHPFPTQLRFSYLNSSPHVILAIDPLHAENIRNGLKTHEFRKYRLPSDVRYCWLYETSPTHGISTVIEVDGLRLQGQVEGIGLGNDNFNNGKNASRFAYPILNVRRLPHLISSTELFSAFSVRVPHRWCPAPSSLSSLLDDRDAHP